MQEKKCPRRSFIRQSASSIAALTLMPITTKGLFEKKHLSAPAYLQGKQPKIRFGVIGMDHGHVYSQTKDLIEAGAELVSAYTKDPKQLATFASRYDQAKIVKSPEEIIEDESIHLIVSASVPADRAPLGIKVMEHGKDFLVDKPGFVSLSQLKKVRKVQKKTGRIYSIPYGRFGSRAALKASELVKAGAIGQVVQSMGVGPHRMNPQNRPSWFFDRAAYGGILCDLATHQFDYFLHYTGSTEAEIISSQIGNISHPQYPGIEDFGDAHVRGNKGTGYMRVDWYSPDGLNTWGDGRNTILGTEGYIEIRHTIDLDGKEGTNHLFLVNGDATKRIDCGDVPLPFSSQLINDIVHRTETAQSQKQSFLASELTLRAQAQAKLLIISK